MTQPVLVLIVFKWDRETINVIGDTKRRLLLTSPGPITLVKFLFSSISLLFPPSNLFIFIFIPSLQAAGTRRRASLLRNVFGVSFSRLVTGPRSKQRRSSSNYLPIRHPTKNRGSTTPHRRIYVCLLLRKKKKKKKKKSILATQRYHSCHHAHILYPILSPSSETRST